MAEFIELPAGCICDHIKIVVLNLYSAIFFASTKYRLHFPRDANSASRDHWCEYRVLLMVQWWNQDFLDGDCQLQGTPNHLFGLFFRKLYENEKHWPRRRGARQFTGYTLSQDVLYVALMEWE